MNDDGQALVELALTLPLLLALALGIAMIADIGVAKLALEHAAAEGARAGALTNDDLAIRDAVAAAATPLNGSRVVVMIAPAAGERAVDPRGSMLRVQLAYVIATPVALLPAVTVRGAAARRIEWTP